jgi:hypothetical protein
MGATSEEGLMKHWFVSSHMASSPPGQTTDTTLVREWEHLFHYYVQGLMTYSTLFLAAAIGAFILLQLIVELPHGTPARSLIYLAYFVLAIASGLPITGVIGDLRKVKEVMGRLNIKELDDDLTRKHSMFGSYSRIVLIPYAQELAFMVVALGLIGIGTVVYFS